MAALGFPWKAAAEAAKYQYKLQFLNKERKEGLAVSLVARSLDEDLSEVHNSEHFGSFANEWCELAFSMEIIRFWHNYLHCYYEGLETLE